jgi:enamine deaminase RidA (YjgF/YER057c/UK114 family)
MAAPEFLTPKTLPPTVGYSHIARSNGLPIAFIAGQIPCDASGALVGEGNFKAQVEQVFKNLKTAVEAAGGSMHDLLKLNYYLVESVARSDQPAIREVRDRYVNVANPPASTLAVIHRLAQPGWLVEIEAVVALRG